MEDPVAQIDLQGVTVNVRALRDRLEALDDKTVDMMLGALLDHMGRMRRILLDLEELIEKTLDEA